MTLKVTAARTSIRPYVAAMSGMLVQPCLYKPEQEEFVRWMNDPFEPERSVVPASGVIEGPLDELDEEEESPDAEDPDQTTVVVFIPAERPERQPTPETKVQLRYLEDGSLTLPAFTSIDHLIAACGSNQAWIGIPMEKIDEFRLLVGASIALIDPELSDD